MDRLTARKVRYFAKFHYPLSVIVTDEGFCGSYPDLPGCVGVAESPPLLYARMDELRRDWIVSQLVNGGEVPLPNAHLAMSARTVVRRRVESSETTELIETSWRSVQALA